MVVTLRDSDVDIALVTESDVAEATRAVSKRIHPNLGIGIPTSTNNSISKISKYQSIPIRYTQEQDIHIHILQIKSNPNVNHIFYTFKHPPTYLKQKAHLGILHIRVDALEAVKEHFVGAALWQTPNEHLARFDFGFALLFVFVNPLHLHLAAVDDNIRGLRQLDDLV